MAGSLVERRLRDVGDRLKRLRADLAVADEQAASLADDADEARLRALVSETPLAEHEHRGARRHVVAMQRHRADLVAEIDKLERAQDELLDRMLAEGRPGV